jgi:hypothetical protein
MIKGKVTIFDDSEKKVIYDYEIDDLKLRVYSDNLGYKFWLGGVCPFDGKTILLSIVHDGKLSKDLRKDIKDIRLFKKNFLFDEFDEDDDVYSQLIKYYNDYPYETDIAGLCVHFNPYKYYDEEDFENWGVDSEDINSVESGVAYVSLDDLIRDLLSQDCNFYRYDIKYYYDEVKRNPDDFNEEDIQLIERLIKKIR